jgi:hypothetical protein
MILECFFPKGQKRIFRLFAAISPVGHSWEKIFYWFIDPFNKDILMEFILELVSIFAVYFAYSLKLLKTIHLSFLQGG